MLHTECQGCIPRMDQFSKKKATEKARALKTEHNGKAKDLKMSQKAREKKKKKEQNS